MKIVFIFKYYYNTNQQDVKLSRIFQNSVQLSPQSLMLLC